MKLFGVRSLLLFIVFFSPFQSFYAVLTFEHEGGPRRLN